MYDIIFSDLAQKQLSKLETGVRERIIASLDRIRIRPKSYVKRLVSEKTYALRIGDYRIIMDISENKLLILVIREGHRKNVYG